MKEGIGMLIYLFYLLTPFFGTMDLIKEIDLTIKCPEISTAIVMIVNTITITISLCLFIFIFGD